MSTAASFLLLAVAALAGCAHCSTMLLRDGQELVLDSQTSAFVGTMDYATYTSGFAYKMTTRVQVSGRTINMKFEDLRFSQFVGAPDAPGDPFASTQFTNVGRDPPAFAITYDDDGLFKELIMPEGTNTFQRNLIKGWAATLQINVGEIRNGQRAFRSREKLLQGDCDVTYAVSSNSVRKTVSHTDDCENRVYRLVDDYRSARCDGQTTNKGPGYPSSQSSTVFQVEKESDGRFKLLGLVSTSHFAAQYFTEEGSTQIVFTNTTSVVRERKDSSGDISPSGSAITELAFEWDDQDYKWDVDRDLKAREPLFSTGQYFDESQETIMAALKKGIDMQKEIIGNLDKDDESLQKAHRYGINAIFPAFYALNYDSLRAIADELFADKSELGVMRSNVFGELLGSAGTTASALLVRDLVLENKFDNARDAARILTSVPYHIRRPNTQLVKEFEKLVDADTERFVTLSVPLVMGHLVRMTCKRAGNPKSEENLKCWKEFAPQYVKKFMDRYNSASSMKEKSIILAGLVNLRFGGQSEVLKDIIYGKNGEEETIRSMALRAASWDAFITGKGSNYFLPVFAERKNPVELRLYALEMILYARPQAATLASVVTSLYSEPSYEVVNYAFSLFERWAGNTDPCAEDTSRLVRYYLKFMKQFTGYEVDWGFGVSKTYGREFFKKKYGYGSQTNFYVVGSEHSVAPISVGFFLSNTFMGGYKNYMLSVHLRIEGLAKGLVRKLKKTDPSTWKTSDLQAILSGEMGIRERADQPVRVQVTVGLKGNIIIHRTYDDDSASEDSPLAKILDQFKNLGDEYEINHQRSVQIGAMLYEQPSGIGVPLAALSSTTWLGSLKAKVKRGNHRGLLYRDLDYDFNSFVQAMRGVMLRHPIRKAVYGLMNDRVYLVHIPRRVVLGVNPIKRELKISVSRPEYDHPLKVLMHSQTSVLVRGNNIKGDYDSLKDNCPSCENRAIITRGPEFVNDRVFVERECQKAGYFVKGEYFRCEMDIRAKNTIGRALVALAPYNKSPKTPYNSLVMGLRQIRAFLYAFPKNEQCGAMFRWSQSSTNPVKEIEISIRGSGESNGERLFFRGKKILAKALIKAKGEPEDRISRINLMYEYTPGNIQNKIKLQINRAAIPALDIEPYSMCLAVENEYPPFTAEFMDYDENSQMDLTGKAMIQYGNANSCGEGDGEIRLKFKHSTTAEARKQLKNKWYYKQCMDKWAEPQWKERSSFPITEACFMTLWDATNARRYTWNVQFTKVSNRLKRIAERVRSIVRAGMIPYWDQDPDDDDDDDDSDGDGIGPFLNLAVTFQNDETSADVAIETRHGKEKFEDVPLRLYWSNKLRNLKFSGTLKKLYKAKLISPCVLTNGEIRTNDNVTFSYETPSCWTLASSKCSPTPEYAVFVKKAGGALPLAAKVFVGGHEVDLDASGGTVTVAVNGATISVSNGEQYEHTVDGVEVFRVFRWGSSVHVYSFLRVFVSFDGHFLEVAPAPSANGQHCGICGNYNRNQLDEFSGKAMQKLDSAAALVKEWEWKC